MRCPGPLGPEGGTGAQLRQPSFSGRPLPAGCGRARCRRLQPARASGDRETMDPPFRRDEGRRELIIAGVVGLAGFLCVKTIYDYVLSPDNLPEGMMRTRIKRNEQGRVFLQTRDTDWMEVRLSSSRPGLTLLRDRSGRIYRLPIVNRPQVDLSDDEVLFDVFGDGQWEDRLQVLTRGDGSDVVLTQQEFYRLDY
eukprot:evm.model.scf_1630.4 EVM.evm.TU.scf_1630.4   scf_1630:8338-10306(-)